MGFSFDGGSVAGFGVGEAGWGLPGWGGGLLSAGAAADVGEVCARAD